MCSCSIGCFASCRGSGRWLVWPPASMPLALSFRSCATPAFRWSARRARSLGDPMYYTISFALMIGFTVAAKVFLEAGAVILAAAVILAEPIPPLRLLGILLIAAGVAVVSVSGKRSDASAAIAA